MTQNTAQAEWYKRNKASHIKNTNERRNRIRIENRLFIRSLKENAKCADCGNKYPHYVMDFDHVRDKKVKDISRMMGFSLESLKKEIQKCEIVCANCHRIRTHAEKQ